MVVIGYSTGEHSIITAVNNIFFIYRGYSWSPLVGAIRILVDKSFLFNNILENEVSVLNNVLYADLTGVFLVVGCTLFISLVNCLSEISEV